MAVLLVTACLALSGLETRNRSEAPERGVGSAAEAGLNGLLLRQWGEASPWSLTAGSAAVQRRPVLVFGIRGVNELVLRGVRLEVGDGAPVAPPLFALTPFPDLPVRCRELEIAVGEVKLYAATAAFRPDRVELAECVLELPGRNITIWSSRATWSESDQAFMIAGPYGARSPKGVARGRGLVVARDGQLRPGS